MLESMQPSLTPWASACLCVYARPAASAAAAFDDCFDDGDLPLVGLILGGALEAALEGLHSELRREGRGEFAASEAPRFDAPAASNNDALGRRLAKTC